MAHVSAENALAMNLKIGPGLFAIFPTAKEINAQAVQYILTV